MAKKKIKTEVKTTQNVEVDAKETAGVAVKKAVYKRWWFWTAIAAVLVIALVLGTTLSYAIPSWGIRIACKPGKESVPEDYEQVLADTKVIANVDYGSAYENGFMDIYSRKNVTGYQPVVVYIHGGYYIGGDKSGSEPYCRVLAQKGFVVASINYALAPEAKYPTQARQVNEAIAFLVENAGLYHVDSEQIFIGGDSAGGHLSAQMGAFYTNIELASKMNIQPAVTADSIKGLLLLCGFYNTDTVRDCKFPFLPTAMWALTDVRKFENYSRIDELNVVKNADKNYPSSFIVCGDADPFYSQSEELAETLTAKGVDTVSYLPKSGENKLKHEFQKDFSLPECNEAMEMTIAFLTERSVFDEGTYDPDKEIHAIFSLSTGDTFDVLLMPEYAPQTVANFIKYAEAGFYNGTAFHRVIPNQVLQGGGYTMTDNGEYRAKNTIYDPIFGEFAENGYSHNSLSHTAGVISAARASDFNSATSQFFFCAVDILGYDGKYAAFGIITSEGGVDALRRMVSAPLDGERPAEPIILVSVSVSYVDKV